MKILQHSVCKSVIGVHAAHGRKERQARAAQGEESTKRVTAMEEFFERNCFTRGYHVCKEVWGAAIGESVVCEREPEDTSNRYAVAVRKELS